jgi:flagellar hook-length control protein FliK
LSTPARSQAQTSNGPVKTDKKDQASLQQEGTESQGTDPGQQGGQPVACPDTSIAISSGVVTDDPITDQEGSKANPMVKTAIGTKAQEGAIALKASMDQMDTVSGKSEGESDGSSKTTELLLATSTTQTGGSPAAVSGQVLSRVTHTPSTTDEGTGQPKDSSVGLRLETTSPQQGGAGDPALNMTSMVSVELSKDQGQGVPQKDPVRVAKHDGASTVQTQIWPNAGLVVESLTDLGGPISGQIDDSMMQQLVEKNRLSLHGQVVSSIRGALETQTHRLSVELNPPELGKVLIRFEQQEGRLTGLLEVDNRATAADIKQALPQIIQNLQDSGIQIKHLDVMLNDQNQRSSRDSALADMYQGRSGQQDQGRPWSSADQAVYPNSTPDTAAVSPESARPQVSIGTDGSINLLM